MNPSLSKTTLALALGLSACVAHSETEPDWMKELRQLRQDVMHLKSELAQLKAERAAAGAPITSPPVEAGALAPATSTPMASSPAAVMPPTEPESRVSLFGYGEMFYTRPLRNSAQTQATARRAVLGFGYQFNERTRFAAELEIENAVVSSSDKGEAAFEQLYVEHDLADDLSLKAGLFLLPLGYLNESHEPTRYYGVTRNQIETAIIPTTWREMGVGLMGRTDSGWRWNTGLVTSFDLTKWRNADASDTKASPLPSWVMTVSVSSFGLARMVLAAAFTAF